MKKTAKQIKKRHDKTTRIFGTMSLTSGFRIYIINQSHIFNLKIYDYFRYNREHIFLFDKGFPIS